MKFTFLGAGSAFTMTNYHSNMLLEVGDQHLLIDCGGDIRFALRDAGYQVADIDALYVSHLHADHCTDLVGMSYAHRYHPDGTPPPLPTAPSISPSRPASSSAALGCTRTRTSLSS